MVLHPLDKQGFFAYSFISSDDKRLIFFWLKKELEKSRSLYKNTGTSAAIQSSIWRKYFSRPAVVLRKKLLGPKSNETLTGFYNIQ